MGIVMRQSAAAPAHQRRIGVAYLYFFGARGGILFGYDLGVMSDHLGLAYSSFRFAAASVVPYVLVRRNAPEAKGRSLEQIEPDPRGRAGKVGA
jgi:hypothetical protein